MKYEEIKQLVELLESSKLAEFTFKNADGDELSLKKYSGSHFQAIPVSPPPPPVSAPIQQEQPKQQQANTPQITTNAKYIKSPLVGVFYSKPSPDASPFVEEGQKVEAGQVVAIIEAMKIMNQIKASESGIITKVLVSDAAPVEYGQKLFELE